MLFANLLVCITILLPAVPLAVTDDSSLESVQDQNKTGIINLLRNFIPTNTGGNNTAATGAEKTWGSWPLPRVIPPFNEHRTFLSRPLTKCRLHPVTWANISLSRAKLPHGRELDAIFRSVSNQSQSVGQLGTTYTTHLAPFLSRSSLNVLPVSALIAAQEYECSIVFIYASWCPFSMAASPFVNALARAYPQFNVFGVKVDDYLTYKWSLHMFFVPKLKIFVEGRIFREYNGSDTDLDALVNFVWYNTRQKPMWKVKLEEEDYIGPIPAQLQKRLDPWLISSWFVTIIGLMYVMAVGSARISSFLTSLVHTVGQCFGLKLQQHINQENGVLLPREQLDLVPIPR